MGANKEFWHQRIKPLERHVAKRENSNDLVARQALESYRENIYLKRYLKEDQAALA